MEVVDQRCAGLDVGKDGGRGLHPPTRWRRWAPPGGAHLPDVQLRSGVLAEWLQDHDVPQVVLEATGQYWKPIW